jgi:hypothetical protein
MLPLPILAGPEPNPAMGAVAEWLRDITTIVSIGSPLSPLSTTGPFTMEGPFSTHWIVVFGSGLPQGLGSGRDRHRRGWIVGRLELLSEIRTEGAIVDGATNLKQQIGAASRPAHLL